MAGYEPFKYYETTSVRLNEGIDMLRPVRYNGRTACESIPNWTIQEKIAAYDRLAECIAEPISDGVVTGQNSSNEKLQEALEEQVKLMGEISKLKEQQGAEQKAMKTLELTIKEQNNTIDNLKRQLEMASTWQADTGPKSPIKTILCLGFAFLLGIAATIAIQQGAF